MSVMMQMFWMLQQALLGRVVNIHLVVEDGCKETVDDIFRACGDCSLFTIKPLVLGALGNDHKQLLQILLQVFRVV